MDHRLLQAALAEVNQIRHADAPIPRLIHMTAADKNLPGPIKANVDSIRGLNPDWVLRLYDDHDIEEFLRRTYGPAVHAIHASIDPRYGAARADLFRYLCVFARGGVYLDLKSATSVSLDTWLRADDRYILSQWDNGPGGKYEDWGLQANVRHVPGGEYQQWFIASSAGHAFLKAVIESVLRNVAGYGPLPVRIGRQGVVAITGPIAYTLAIYPLLKQHPHRVVSVEPEGFLRYSIFDGERGHYVIFKNHYSQLRDPIVKLTGPAYGVFLVARQCKETADATNEWIRRLLSKIKRVLLRR